MATQSSQSHRRDRPTDRSPMDLLIVSTFAGGGIHQYTDEQATRLPERLSVRTYDMESPSSGSGVLWFLGGLLSALWAAVKFPFRRPPDIVHVHTSHRFSFYRASFYVFVAAYVWRRPVILHIHGSSFDEFARTESGLVSRLQNAVFHASDRVVVLSEYWRDVLSVQLPEAKIEVLPNAVDPDEYHPDYSADPPHVVFVSNLIERKGVAELLTALRELEEAGVPYRASIAGKGPFAEQVAELADASGNIDYLGYVSEERKRDLLDSGSIFVLPTHAEGLPIAMLEGMAGGNAIVSTTVGSIPEVIDEDSGILLEPGDRDGLAAALLELVSDPERTRRMARRNRQLVEDRYSWGRTTDRLEELYADERPDSTKPQRVARS